MKKRKHFNIDDVPDAVKRLNPHLFNEHGGKKFNPIQPIRSKEVANAPSKPPMTIETIMRDFPVIANAENNMADTKTRIASLNKTELRFYETVIPEVFKGQEYVIIVQPTRLFEMIGGGTYTPGLSGMHKRHRACMRNQGQLRALGGVGTRHRKIQTWAAAQFNRLCIQFAMYTWDTKAKRWHVSKWDDEKQTPVRKKEMLAMRKTVLMNLHSKNNAMLFSLTAKNHAQYAAKHEYDMLNMDVPYDVNHER